MRPLPLVILIAAVSASSSARAWCDFEEYPDLDGTNSSCASSVSGSDDDCDQPLPFVSTLLFEIEADCAGWDSFLGSVTLDCTNESSHVYYKKVVGHLIDSSLQAWARDARSAIKVGIIGFADDALPDSDDGRNTISVSNSCAGSTGNADVEEDGLHVDLIFKGGCASGSTNIATVASLDGGGSGAYRIVRHEIGHALGLAHQCNSDGVSSNCPSRNPENVCVDGPLMAVGAGGQNWKTDFPHGEDIEGIQELHRGDTLNGAHRNGAYVTPNSMLPRRDIILTQATLSSASPPALTETANSSLGLYSIYPGRIDCRRGNAGGSGPDCVIARAWTEMNLRVNAVSVVGAGSTPTIGTTHTTNGVRTRRAPDVSLSHSTNPVEDIAVALVAQQEPFQDENCTTSSDCASGETCSNSVCKVSCTSNANCDADETCVSSFCKTAYNAPRSSVVHRYTNLTGTPSHSSFELDTSGDDDITSSDPRITYVRSLGNSCTSGSCSNGWLLTHGRFLIMQARRDRTPVFYLSNVGGTSFGIMTEDTNGSVPKLTQRMIHEGLDIECPTHTTTSGSVDDRDCRVVFDSYRERFDVLGDTTPGGEQMTCTIRLGTSSTDVLRFQNLGCTTNTGFGADRSYTVSLTDYGTGTPSTQRQSRGWLLTQAAPSPNEGASATNSRLRLWNHGGTTLTTAALVQSYSYTLDKITCDSMDGEKAMSYFGGTSLDYAEDAQRIYRLDWGTQGAADVPDDLCY